MLAGIALVGILVVSAAVGFDQEVTPTFVNLDIEKSRTGSEVNLQIESGIGPGGCDNLVSGLDVESTQPNPDTLSLLVGDFKVNKRIGVCGGADYIPLRRIALPQQWVATPGERKLIMNVNRQESELKVITSEESISVHAVSIAPHESGTTGTVRVGAGAIIERS